MEILCPFLKKDSLAEFSNCKSVMLLGLAIFLPYHFISYLLEINDVYIAQNDASRECFFKQKEGLSFRHKKHI
jgi:hypothetical protein